MPRQRMIKPDFWSDQKIIELSIFERLLFIGLWNFAEDNGAQVYTIKSLKACLFPADEISLDQIEKALNNLEKLKLITLYSDSENLYLYINNWKKHQKINRPNPTNIPLPNNLQQFSDHSVKDHGTITDQSLLSKDKLREDKLKERISCDRFSQIDHECEDNFSNSNTEQQEEIKQTPKQRVENKHEPTEFIFLAKYLQAGKVRKFGENGKDPTEKDLNRWAKDIRLMVTTDKLKYQGEPINHDVVKNMIDHVSRTDNQFRVESGRSLREKAGKILISMSAPSPRASPKQGEALTGIGQIKSGRLN